MILFVVICAVMVAIALASVLPPLLSGDESNLSHESKEANVSVYRDQLNELEADLRNGIIAQDQYQQDRDSIERRMLEDVSIAGRLMRLHWLFQSSRWCFTYKLAIRLQSRKDVRHRRLNPEQRKVLSQTPK